MGLLCEMSAHEKKEVVSSDWKTVELNGTREKLLSLESYFADSYNWETEERISYLSKIVNEGIELKNDTTIFFYSEKLGVIYREIDSISLALITLNQAVNHAYDPKSTQIAYNSLGGLHFKSRDYNTALDYYFKSLEAARKLNNGSEAYPIGNISEVYASLNDFENTLKYLKYSLEFSSKLESPEKEYSLIYDNAYITDCYSEINEIDSARQSISLVLDNIKIIDTLPNQKYRDACFIGYFSAAELYLKIGNTKKAKEYIRKTREFAHKFFLSSVYLLEAKYQILIKDYAAALDVLKLDIIKEEYSGQNDILELKAICYEGLGDYKKAIEIKNDLIEFQKKDSGNDRIKFSAFANVKYETFQKNEKIKSLQLDQEVKSLTIQNQRYIVFLSLILGAFLALTAFVLWRQFQTRRKANKYLQKEIALKTEDLRQSNEELRTLSFVASHDIKEPLRNIGNYVGLIKRKLPDAIKADLNDYFETISRSSSQLYTLVEDISKYISMPKGAAIDKMHINLNQLVDDVFLSLKTLNDEKQGKLINEGLPEQLMTNSTLLFVVLKNLVENGLKFNTSEVPTVKLSYEMKGENHRIRVSDNGLGIEKEYQESLFNSFKRLHNRSEYEGSGMGLTMAKLMIEKLNGHIELESSIGEGSDFVIVIPE